MIGLLDTNALLKYLFYAVLAVIAVYVGSYLLAWFQREKARAEILAPVRDAANIGRPGYDQNGIKIPESNAGVFAAILYEGLLRKEYMGREQINAILALSESDAREVFRVWESTYRDKTILEAVDQANTFFGFFDNPLFDNQDANLLKQKFARYYE